MRLLLPLLALPVLAGTVSSTALAADDEIRARLPLVLDRNNLNGGRSRGEAETHLPPGFAVEDARLVVRYANALAVEPSDSSLQVEGNGVPLASLPLTASQGSHTAEIALPDRLLRPGRNRIGFEADQKHRAHCTRDAFSELWTKIEHAESHVDVTLRPLASPIPLARLDALLGSSIYDGEEAVIMMRRTLDDPAALDWGGAVAEGLALRRGDRPLVVAQEPLEGWSLEEIADVGRNVVIVGTFTELRGVLPARRPKGSDSGLAALVRLPGDPRHVALILSGQTDLDVARAVAAFRAQDRRWPDESVATVATLPPSLVPDPEVEITSDGARVPLSALGYETRNLPISYVETIDLPLDLPSDYFAGDGQDIVLHLDYAYGAGLDTTSSLVVRVNGAPWNMLRLDNGSGDIVEGAEVELPMGLFQPGPNVIALEPVLDPIDETVCAGPGHDAMFSLFDDSSIEVPHFARLARQPDLRLMAATGFPYGDAETGVAMVVPDLEPETVSALWTLRGRLAQRHGGPLGDVVSGTEVTFGDRHVLVVGGADRLAPDLVAAAPVPLVPLGGDEGPRAIAAAEPGTSSRDQWEQRLELRLGRDDRNLIDNLTDWMIGMARAVPTPADVDLPTFEALGHVDRAGTMVSFRSPHAEDRTVTIISAPDADGMMEAVERLIGPVVWNQLSGDVGIWMPEAEAPITHRVGEPYVVEPVQRSTRHLWLLWRTFMARNPELWIGLVFSMIALLSLTTGLALRKRWQG